MITITPALIFVLCFCHGLAFAQTDWPDIFTPNAPRADDLFPKAFTRIDGTTKDFDQSAKQTFAIEFGPKWVELQGSYFEKRQKDPSAVDLQDDPGATKWGRYFDLVAITSPFGGRWVGEGGLAYSTLSQTSVELQQPLMTRLGIKGQWGKLGYGLSYGTFGRGFVALNGAKTEQDRNERQIYSEYDFGLFRIRGAVGEGREKHFETQQLTLTQTAAVSLYLNKPDWSATLSSSYSWTGHGEYSTPKTPAFINGLSLIYRPMVPLAIEPGLNFKQEWDALTRLKSDSPSATLGLAYTPLRELQIKGRASYARDLSADPLKEGSLFNTTTAFNWNIGKSFLGEQALSLQFEYKNESRQNLPNNSHSNVTGTVQFKISGF